MSDPPYRIVSERLVIRCWEPLDAPLLKEAIDSSLEHLQPWMPWARAEPQELSEKVDLLRRFRGQFDLGTDFVMGIFRYRRARCPRRHGITQASRRRRARDRLLDQVESRRPRPGDRVERRLDAGRL